MDRPVPTVQPSEQAWCLICRSFRPYRNITVAPGSVRFEAGYDADHLQCTGCDTTLLTVRAASRDGGES